MDERPNHVAVVPRWRVHLPGYVTRVALLHTAAGTSVDLADRRLAERVAEALNTEEAKPPTRGISDYRCEPWYRAKVVIRRVRSAAEVQIFGISSDRLLAQLVTDALNRLDPGRIAPARPIRWYWF